MFCKWVEMQLLYDEEESGDGNKADLAYNGLRRYSSSRLYFCSILLYLPHCTVVLLHCSFGWCVSFSTVTSFFSVSFCSPSFGMGHWPSANQCWPAESESYFSKNQHFWLLWTLFVLKHSYWTTVSPLGSTGTVVIISHPSSFTICGMFLFL